MKKASVITSGLPTVQIGKKTYTLTPTLQAVRLITQLGGGLVPAYKRCSDMDIDMIAGVISAGAGLSFSDEEKLTEFAEAIWKEDHQNYRPGVSQFFLLLFNGGKPKVDEDPKGDASEGNE